MIINSKTYPILEKLENNSLGKLSIFEKDKTFFYLMGTDTNKYWKFCIKDFKSDVNIISESFSNASIKAQKKLSELYSDIVENNISDFDVKGTYILGDFVCMIKYEFKKDSQDIELFLFMFDKNGLPIAIHVNSSQYDVKLSWVSSGFDISQTEPMITKFVLGWVCRLIIIKMFKSYAQVETKILSGKSKIKGKGYKHLNETNLEICFLDSKWFTNLVKSESFNVSGHFRLQPKKKEGSWTKELIWINEFVKNGYTSKARILTNS